MPSGEVLVFCDRCGARNRESARFCRLCGEAVWHPAEPGSGESTAQLPHASPSPTPAPSLASNRIGDRYGLQQTLGRGGMGIVYCAHDPVLDRRVAIKVLRKELSEDPGTVQRFLKEARIAAGLRHPNIVSIHDVGESGGHHYYVMDLIEGKNLAERVEQYGPVPLQDAKRILREVARAIAFAHEAGVLHRDLKPENVMLDQADHVLVLDFGLARAAQDPRLTWTGRVVGSPRYMSPEQLNGRDIANASDVFSVGLLFYYLLAGTALFDGATVDEIHEQHRRWEIASLLDRLRLPEPDVELLKLLLAREPRERPADLLLATRLPVLSAL